MKTICIGVISVILGLSNPVLSREVPNEDSIPERDLAEGQVLSNFSISLSPPGARSLGMGATFIGIADDATASESNPAGLTSLTREEISIHLRQTKSEIESVEQFPGFFSETTSFQSATSGPSFLSYVYPVLKKNMAFSIYARNAVDSRSFEEFSDGADQALFSSALSMDHIGFSGAYQINEKVSLGASIRYTQVKLDLKNQLALFFPFTDPLFDAFLSLDQQIEDSDHAVTFNVGLLFNPGEKLSVGIVFNSGQDFVFDTYTAIDATFINLPIDDAGRPFVLPLEDDPRERHVPSRLSIPDSIGAGFAFRPNSNWVLGLDLIRTNYSQNTGRYLDEPLSAETEVHVGVEYGFALGAQSTPFFVRAGYFTTPDIDGTDLIDSKREYTTFGAGVFLKNKLQLDAAIAVADKNTETLISMVWRL